MKIMLSTRYVLRALACNPLPSHLVCRGKGGDTIGGA
jgi:hypothetical protein